MNIKRITAMLMALTLLCTGCLVSCGTSAGAETTAATADTSAMPTETTAASAQTTAAATTTAPPAADDPDARPTDREYRILFVGNSYTHYNSMPTAMFRPIALAAGYRVRVDTVTEGGHHLWEFADIGDEHGAQLRTLLKMTDYDVVILQEQSHTPISNPARFYTGVRDLCELIHSYHADTEVVLYATWGYQKGNANLSKYGATTKDMEMKIRAAYTAIGEELSLTVAHVGAGMTHALEKYPLSLYNDDKTHPSEVGSTLAAMTLFSTIFRVHPSHVEGYVSGLSNNAYTNVVKTAAYIYENGAPVSDAAKTSSVGVAYESVKYDSGIDIEKTVNLTAAPASSIISYLTRTSTQTGNGWVTLKRDATQTFSGIRGDKDAIAASDYGTGTLSEAQRADIADIGYGVSVIGMQAIRADKKGTTTAVENLVNGHWGSSYMAAMTFDEKTYDIAGNETAGDGYTALITLNFGQVHTFDAIGYFSGSLEGFPQVQEVFVSDDGVSWTRVESACYDALAMAEQEKKLVSATGKPADPWNNNTATVQCLFDMGGVSGKYIRIGIHIGGDVDSVGLATLPTQKNQTINTREIVVYGASR